MKASMRFEAWGRSAKSRGFNLHQLIMATRDYPAFALLAAIHGWVMQENNK